MERNENGFSALFPRSIGGVTDNGMNGNSATDNGNGVGNSAGEGCLRARSSSACRNACSGQQLAMVYSPMQCWRMLYTPEEALIRGTLFEELDKPYEEEW